MQAANRASRECLRASPTKSVLRSPSSPSSSWTVPRSAARRPSLGESPLRQHAGSVACLSTSSSQQRIIGNLFSTGRQAGGSGSGSAAASPSTQSGARTSSAGGAGTFASTPYRASTSTAGNSGGSVSKTNGSGRSNGNGAEHQKTSSGGVNGGSSSSSSASQPKSSPSASAHDQDGDDGQQHDTASRRSMLYVPGSSEKMIKKSQASHADTIIFDLEDSVAAHRKGAAREAVLHGLNAAPRPGPELAVRINPPSGDQSIASDDLDIILPSPQLQAIVMPKVESAEDVRMVLDKAETLRTDSEMRPLALILSVESAASLINMPSIVNEVRSWKRDDLAYVSALLFASEDYCASTNIIRTKSRRELLFPRAHMATIAKALDLAAIDMVCVDYKDQEYLAEECRDGRELGFDGKQAIHPAQVDEIQRSFSPSEADVHRAARIKAAYEQSVRDHKGAVGMKEGDSMVMIDAPMLKQAEATLAKARAAKMEIPDVREE